LVGSVGGLSSGAALNLIEAQSKYGVANTITVARTWQLIISALFAVITHEVFSQDFLTGS